MSYISTVSEITGCRFGHAWRVEDGTARADVQFGVQSMILDSAADADAVIAAATAARDALSALEAERPQPGQPAGPQ